MKDSYLLDRRRFIRLGASGFVGAWAGLLLPTLAYAQANFRVIRSPDIELELPGVTKSFSFVHLTDSHLTECDSRNPELYEHVAGRSKLFGGDLLAKTRAVFDASKILEPDFIAFTGDMMDTPTAANLDALYSIRSSWAKPCWFTMGNHEWEKPANPANQAYWQRRLQSIVVHSMDWHVHEFNGVNLLFVDNSNYQFTRDQLERTIAVLKTGCACLLFIHIPLSIESLLPDVEKKWSMRIVVGGSDAMVNPTDTTQEFCALAKSHPAVAAIFAGHVHFEHQDKYRGDSVQNIGRPVFDGGFRRISVKPRSGVALF